MSKKYRIISHEYYPFRQAIESDNGHEIDETTLARWKAAIETFSQIQIEMEEWEDSHQP